MSISSDKFRSKRADPSLDKEVLLCVAFRLEDQASQLVSRLRPNSEERLPIDDFLDELIARVSAPKAHAKALEFFARCFGSPHAWIRYEMGNLFHDIRRIAFHESSKRKSAAEKAQVLMSDGILLSSYLQEFLKEHTAPRMYAYMKNSPFGDEELWHFLCCLEERLHKIDEGVRILAAEARSRLDEMSPAQGGRPPQTWKRYFVGGMAHAWRMLTGARPRPNPQGLFTTFVDCAWSSAEELPDVSWDQAIRDLAKCTTVYEELNKAFYGRPKTKAVA